MALFAAARARRAEALARTTYTQAQVGDAAVPEAHAANAVPATVDVTDGADLPDLVMYAPREVRSWRGRQTIGQPQGTPWTSTGGGGILLNDHMQPGIADPRHVYDTDTPAGMHIGPVGADAELRRTQLETLANFRVPVVEDPQTAPDRTRAGSTGADPTRPAQLPGWTFLRAFDKNMAEQLAPPGLDKVTYRSPIASRPMEYAGIVPGNEPSPGGGQPTEGVGRASAQPNSVRILPRAWDELLVNNGAGQTAAVVTSEANRRVNGWRL